MDNPVRRRKEDFTSNSALKAWKKKYVALSLAPHQIVVKEMRNGFNSKVLEILNDIFGLKLPVNCCWIMLTFVNSIN